MNFQLVICCLQCVCSAGKPIYYYVPQPGTSSEHQGLTEQQRGGSKLSCSQHGWDVLSQWPPRGFAWHRLVEKESGLDLRWGIEWQEGSLHLKTLRWKFASSSLITHLIPCLYSWSFLHQEFHVSYTPIFQIYYFLKLTYFSVSFNCFRTHRFISLLSELCFPFTWWIPPALSYLIPYIVPPE